MATTTNYGWGTPDDTDLVKDGALAIRDLGQDIDTTTKALNPETTEGDIAYRSATANTNTRLGIGTTGQVLTVAGGVPSWGAPAASGLNLIDEVSFTSSNAVNVNDVFSSTYENYRIVLVGTQTAPNTVSIRLRVSGTDTTVNYQYIRIVATPGPTVSADFDVVGNDEFFSGSFDSTRRSAYTYDITGPNLASATSISGNGGAVDIDNFNINFGTQTDSTQFTGFSIICGVAITGKVSVYGYAKE